MKDQERISLQMNIDRLLSDNPLAVQHFLQHHMACVGCSMSVFDTLADALANYGLSADLFLQELQKVLSLQDGGETSLPGEFNERSNTMDKPYTYFPDLHATVEEIPSESILSRTIFRGDGMKAIIFSFAPGQELSEHTASVPAMIHILEGECELTLGGDSFQAGPGAWAAMKPNLPHSLTAKTPVRMLLLMQG